MYGALHVNPLAVSKYNKGLFAIGYNQHHNTPDSTQDFYLHSAGFIGNGNMEKLSDTFRLASSTPHEYQFEWAPEVDANDDIVVWVWEDNSQARVNPEAPEGWPYYYDIHCKVTEWGVPGITEQPVTHPDLQIIQSVGSQITLRYANRTEGFHASVFDASGQKVAELHNPEPSGVIYWGQGQQAGVYFIRELSGNQNVRKVILVR
jgi:hypothetical protein